MLSKLFFCSEVHVNANYSCFLIKLLLNIKYCRKGPPSQNMHIAVESEAATKNPGTWCTLCCGPSKNTWEYIGHDL